MRHHWKLRFSDGDWSGRSSRLDVHDFGGADLQNMRRRLLSATGGPLRSEQGGLEQFPPAVLAGGQELCWSRQLGGYLSYVNRVQADGRL